MLITLFILNYLVLAVIFLVIRSRFTSKKILSSIRIEVDALILELEREADRDVALLESRVKQLRELIAEADKRVLLSKREQEKRQTESAVFPRDFVKEAVSEPQKELFPAPDPIKRVASKPVAQPVVNLPVQPESEAAPVYTRMKIQRSGNFIAPEIPIREKVMDMAQKGFSADIISKTLALPLGEVELMLSMFAQR